MSCNPYNPYYNQYGSNIQYYPVDPCQSGINSCTPPITGSTGLNIQYIPIDQCQYNRNPYRHCTPPTTGPTGSSGPTGISGSSGPIGPTGTKTFIIDHPQDTNKYLVHACLEGPEAGVYYRGIGIIENEEVEITLPDYVKYLAINFSVQITAIGCENSFHTSRVNQDTGIFKVFGKPGEFFWHVYGTRHYINVEPLKADVNIKGSGPYKWI